MNFYIKSFLIFTRIGMFTIGGGYAMVPLIEDELVDKRKWITREDFLDLMALAQTVPGIFAVNIAIFIGYKLRKFWGAFWMALGTILPSFLVILAIALFFQQFKQYPAVENVFKGIRPAVVALIAAPTFKMAKSARINRYNVWIPIVSALLIWLLGFSPIYVIILSGLGGYIYGRLKSKPTFLRILQNRTFWIRRRVRHDIHDTRRSCDPPRLAHIARVYRHHRHQPNDSWSYRYQLCYLCGVYGSSQCRLFARLGYFRLYYHDWCRGASFVYLDGPHQPVLPEIPKTSCSVFRI